jgi:hypothetical protein
MSNNARTLDRVKEIVNRRKKLNSEILQEELGTTEEATIDNYMRAARSLVNKGQLRRLSRGEFVLSYSRRQERFKRIFERAIKEGKYITFEATKEDGTNMERMGSPKEVKTTSAGNVQLLYADQMKNGYRSVLLKNIKTLKMVSS